MSPAGVVCGRKFCSRCRRWRHAVDFYARSWHDDPLCTRPRVLTSSCRTCSTVVRRERGGYRRRDYGDGGWGFGGYGVIARDPEEMRQRRNELNRNSARRRRRDPVKRAQEAEYHRIWRDAKRAQERERAA